MIDQRSELRIGEVSRRTGVAVPTLRAWERRYGLLDPDRTEGGHRLYSDRDVTRVAAMQQLIEDGWSAAAAAREVLRSAAARVQLGPAGAGRADLRAGTTAAGTGVAAATAGGGAAAELVRRLERTIDSFSAAGADEVVDDVLARFEVPRALDEVVLPVLRTVGDGWQDDPRVIAREHFATNVLRPRLHRLLRRPTPSVARTCLAAAPEGEEHDLGLLAAATVAVDAGWRVHYLGARTPTVVMERAVAELDPAVVLVGAVFREQAEAFLRDRPAFERAAVVLGGAGFIGSDASRLPGATVHEGALSTLPATLDRAVDGSVGAR